MTLVRLNHILILVLAWSVLSCDRGKISPGNAPYRSVLEQGLTDGADLARFPRGEVQIMTGPGALIGPADDWERLKFSGKYLDFLQKAAGDGLLTMKEKPVRDPAKNGQVSSRVFTVTPTEKLLRLHDARKSRDKFLVVPVGAMTVIEILKEEPYKLSLGVRTGGDEFKLVLGRVRDTPTEQARILGTNYATVESREVRFRALVQFNPLTKTYRFVTADLGKPGTDAWASQHVP
jgi:hypothetical protein